jgi:hypothetical protein
MHSSSKLIQNFIFSRCKREKILFGSLGVAWFEVGGAAIPKDSFI